MLGEPVCVGDVLGASLLRLVPQMDDSYGGVYLFCGEATSGDLLFPGVAEFFTLLHIPGTIFHPHSLNPRTDLFTGSSPVPPPPPNTCMHTHIMQTYYKPYLISTVGTNTYVYTQAHILHRCAAMTLCTVTVVFRSAASS